MKLFVVSDVHGYYSILKKALDDAGFDPENAEHLLICCGDYFDRGNENVQVLKFFERLKHKVLLRGNHEDLLLKLLETGRVLPHNYINETMQTLTDFFGRFSIDPVDDTESDYGKAMHYLENTYGSGYPKQTYYIKWLEVEKNTDYTFSGEYLTLKNGKGWFGILDGNRYVPNPIQKYFFNGLENTWCKVGVTFNTGEFDRIGFAVCDCGGEAFIDNLNLFKA